MTTQVQDQAGAPERAPLAQKMEMTTHTQRDGRAKRSAKSGMKRSSRRGGAAIIEFALVVPVLLTLLIGIMEFGWLVKNNLMVANAAREGARCASVGKPTTEIRTRVANSMAPLSVTSPTGTVIINWSDNNGDDKYIYPVTDSGSSNSVKSGKLIKVIVRTKHKPLTGFFPFLKDRTIETYATMRRE
jgi:Flp pilus assembly protein TadG